MPFEAQGKPALPVLADGRREPICLEMFGLEIKKRRRPGAVSYAKDITLGLSFCQIFFEFLEFSDDFCECLRDREFEWKGRRLAAVVRGLLRRTCGTFDSVAKFGEVD
jgi:hypothetical protein